MAGTQTVEHRPLTDRSYASIVATLLVAMIASVAHAGPVHPFPQHVPLAAGTLLPSNHSRAQLDDDVRALYDVWTQRYLAQAGTEGDGHPRYRVLFSRDPGDK